ncbi:hypothetical protein AAFF_G00085200 [Aldrovandia affinis]|uniref:Uncharacterized protein n=1 Tax=Aldrovandia affinis TaxID=143900 RepID=A0AAD7RWP0_9TELE|nr:hypothetical protein AAFF_G00085200 [Aldrovandia affinis]
MNKSCLSEGSSPVFQYVKGKPEPWEIKVYFLFGRSGLADDCVIYQEKKINAAGTARVCHFPKPPLISDKEMAKNVRGNHDEIRSRDGKVVVTKWFDNHAVVMASNSVGVGEEGEVGRWEKSEGALVRIKRPEVVQTYTQATAGSSTAETSNARVSLPSTHWIGFTLR